MPLIDAAVMNVPPAVADADAFVVVLLLGNGEPWSMTSLPHATTASAQPSHPRTQGITTSTTRRTTSSFRDFPDFVVNWG
jgi:hypothetical protein